MTQWSPAETQLFKKLGLTNLLYLAPGPAYRLACESAFLSGEEGPLIEALRRGSKAFLLAQGPPRLTPEFDALVDLSGGQETQT